MVSGKKIFLVALLFVGMVLKGCSGNAASFQEIDTVTYGNWEIEAIVIDDSFLFNEMFFSNDYPNEISYRLIDHINWADFENTGISPMGMSDFLNSVIDLVAFRDGNVYAISMAPMLGADEYTGSMTGLSIIDTNQRNVRYLADAGVGMFFGGFDFAHHIYFDYDNNKTYSFHMDSRPSGLHEAGIFHNSLIRNSWSTDELNPDLSSISGNISIIHTFYSTGLPIVGYFNNYAILNYIDIYGKTYVLGYLDAGKTPAAVTVNVIAVEDFTVDDFGLMTGRIPLYAAKNEYGVYFQTIVLDGEFLDFGGASSIYFYDFETNEYTHVMDLEDSITYINGNNNVIIYNYHSVDSPSSASGRIIFLENQYEVVIPHITAVNDIVFSSITDEYIFIASKNHIIVYDLVQRTFDCLDTRLFSNGLISNIVFSENHFGWICFDDNGKITFYRAFIPNILPTSQLTPD